MLIVKRRLGNAEVETFEIPEDQLQQYKTVAVSGGQSSSNKEAIDLYKMEYERCAQRYDDLYGAAWTNFSYIALIAGAILTFGSDSFMTEVSIFVATLPLLFWWIATFEPLNRYGDQVQARAACIETLLNEAVGIGSPERRRDQESAEGECEKGLRHFQDYSKRQFERIEWRKFGIIGLFWIALSVIVIYGFDFSKTRVLVSLLLAGSSFVVWLDMQSQTSIRLWQVLRVRFIVRVFAGILIMVAIGSAYQALEKHQQKEPFIKSKADSKLPERLTIKVEK